MTVGRLGAALALVGTIAGGVLVMEDRHAADEDVVELTGYVDRNFRDTSDIIKQLKKDTQKQFRDNQLHRLRWQLWDLKRRTGCNGPAQEYCQHLQSEINRLRNMR